MKFKYKWLWVFLGLFLIPEIFFSPVFNSFYVVVINSPGHYPRPNFLTLEKNWRLSFVAILFQLVGLVSSFIFLKIMNRRSSLCISLRVLISLLIFLTVFVLFCVFYFRNGVDFFI